MAKYKAWTENDNIIVQCIKCKTQHIFNSGSYLEYILDNSPFSKDPIDDDIFQLSGNILSPIWVCRNVKCNNWAQVKIENSYR